MSLDDALNHMVLQSRQLKAKTQMRKLQQSTPNPNAPIPPSLYKLIP